MTVGSHWQAGSAFIPQVESRPPTGMTDAYHLVSVAKNTASLIFTEFINNFTQSHVVTGMVGDSMFSKENENNY